MPLAPRLLSDDMVGLKAAIAGLGIVALPAMCAAMNSGQVRCAESLNGSLGIFDLTAPVPYRQGPLPFVRAFLDHLAAEFPKVVLM